MTIKCRTQKWMKTEVGAGAEPELQMFANLFTFWILQLIFSFERLLPSVEVVVVRIAIVMIVVVVIAIVIVRVQIVPEGGVGSMHK